MSISNPLVTVVIPTYGRPTFLKRAIVSVLDQTYNNIEIIVVDDNNPDTSSRKETEKIVKCFVKSKQITYLQHDKNKNGSAARNTGWRKASGKYITFLDDDDIIKPDKIKKQVETLEQLDDKWGACYTGYQIIKERGRNQVSSQKSSGDCFINALMRTLFLGSGSNLLLRKNVVDKINGYDETFLRNQDIEFLVRVCEKYKVAFIPERLLTIMQEGERPLRTFKQIDNITLHYLSVFENKINSLDEDDRKRVLYVISLERFRAALFSRNFKIGISILKKNNVPFKYVFKYVLYLLHRFISGKSYGFYIKK